MVGDGEAGEEVTFGCCLAGEWVGPGARARTWRTAPGKAAAEVGRQFAARWRVIGIAGQRRRNLCALGGRRSQFHQMAIEGAPRLS